MPRKENETDEEYKKRVDLERREKTRQSNRERRRINELFDTSFNYTKSVKKHQEISHDPFGESKQLHTHYRRFTVVDTRVTVILHEEKDKVYHVMFVTDGNFDRNPKVYNKQVIRIFSGIFQILIDFEKEAKPNEYYFLPYKGDQNLSRVYSNFMRVFSKKYGFLPVKKFNPERYIIKFRRGLGKKLMTKYDAAKAGDSVVERRLDELFKTDLPFRVETSLFGTRYYFDDYYLMVFFEKIVDEDDNDYELSFVVNGNFYKNDKTPNKDSMKIFSSVIQAVRHFVSTTKPNSIGFYAFGGDQKLSELYDNMVKYLRKYYQFEINKDGKYTVISFNHVSDQINEQRLDELFDSKVPLQWINEDSGITAIGNIDGFRVSVKFEPRPPKFSMGLENGYDLSFRINGNIFRDGLKHNKFSIKIFSLVLQAVKTFMDNKKPKFLAYIGMDDKLQKMYDTLIKSLARKYNFEVKKHGARFIIFEENIQEMVRIPVVGKLNASYTVEDGGKIVGQAEIDDGVITLLRVNDMSDINFTGQVLSTLLQNIIYEADYINANLSMHVKNDEKEIIRFLERFGFFHINNNIYKRRAGSIRPPSVMENNEFNFNDL